MEPVILEERSKNEMHLNIFSKLLSERIIFLSGEIDTSVANNVIAQLLYLDSSKDIVMYINSPGGSVLDGLAIYDTMNLVKSDIVTVCIGFCASMASVLLSSGAKGKRYALPNSQIMIHQASSGTQGTIKDMEVSLRQSIKMNDKIKEILSHNCSQSLDKIDVDTSRDYWLDADESKNYGLIDHVVKKIF
jgi:ATP-dependent Clp protease protease subunit